MEVIGQAVRSLASGGTFPRCDLSELFQMAATEAHSSHAMDRTLRVVLSLSSVPSSLHPNSLAHYSPSGSNSSVLELQGLKTDKGSQQYWREWRRLAFS